MGPPSPTIKTSEGLPDNSSGLLYPRYILVGALDADGKPVYEMADKKQQDAFLLNARNRESDRAKQAANEAAEARAKAEAMAKKAQEDHAAEEQKKAAAKRAEEARAAEANARKEEAERTAARNRLDKRFKEQEDACAGGRSSEACRAAEEKTTTETLAGQQAKNTAICMDRNSLEMSSGGQPAKVMGLGLATAVLGGKGMNGRGVQQIKGVPKLGRSGTCDSPGGCISCSTRLNVERFGEFQNNVAQGLGIGRDP